MKKYLILMLSGALFSSCIDTVVLPNNVTIGEEYWQSKDDVTGMVMGAYKSMCAANVIERCLVWGDLRSEELVPSDENANNSTISALVDINNGNMDYDNTYASWADFYSVINKCNIVLERGEGVVSIDPSYTTDTWYTDQSQMLALRSLCYFYLIRAFRDVPYNTVASFNSSQNFVIPQEAPLTVLDSCISDCQKALKHTISPSAYGDWRRVGVMTKDGINALLADMYLWRASMTHNASDYQNCIDYCDAVITSKKEQYPQDEFSETQQEYPLVEGKSSFSEVFSTGNSKESIFELQMDGSNTSNDGIRNCFWNIGSSNSAYKMMAASGIFSKDVDNGGVYYDASKDYRLYDNVYDVTVGDEASVLQVRKYVAPTSDVSIHGTTTGNGGKAYSYSTKPGTSKVARNWIVYRLSDIMLMKAEALVELASDDASDTNLSNAFHLVNAVYKRSLVNEKDSLSSSNFTSKSSMETLVMQERLRELCFEGKRWFDLMRYNYRHMDGLQPDKTMSEISNGVSGTTMFPQNSDEFFELLKDAGKDISAKEIQEPSLYFPIIQTEMTVNNLLKQNPAYTKGSSIQKN